MFTAAHGHLGSAASVTVGYRPALAVSAALSLAGAVVAMATGGRRGHHPQVDTGGPAVPDSAGEPDSATVPDSAATIVNDVAAAAPADAPL
ncbi:MAG TPA: hypothetical protein VHZ03_51285 [Trebonia sp.]|nr:hypothetical protein [Trebonia sp.]